MSDPGACHSVAPVRIAVEGVLLEGDRVVPSGHRGAVLFAHGSGSSRHSPRNRYVAGILHEAELATLLIDLLTQEEEAMDQRTRRLRFDIGLLAERLAGAAKWLEAHLPGTRIGFFGASTGGGAALVAAAEQPAAIRAVVSRGGRPDLAGEALPRVRASTLLIVGSDDREVLALNEQAMERMTGAEVKLEIVPGAGHLFQEPGVLGIVAAHARDWFLRHLSS